MSGEIVWCGFTRAALDAAYNNSAIVPDSAARIAEWTTRSAATRARPGTMRDLPYGPRPRNRIDVFRADAGAAPLLVWFHGGYWQRNSKEVFSCLAEGPLKFGMDVAMPGYTLAPKATLTEIVAETTAALALLRDGGFARGPIIVAGWSAGGQLAAMASERPGVAACLTVSGVFDVEPCRHNYLQEKLRLGAAEAREMSPLYRITRSRVPMVVAWGGEELPELRRQSRDYAAARAAVGLRTRALELAGENHFSILEQVARPDGALARELAALAAQS
ncbi:MAG: alpha/beta hydrolase [Acetobacteraceae bacterium]